MVEHAEPVFLSLISPRLPSGAPRLFLKDPFLGRYSSLASFCPYETSPCVLQVPMLASCWLQNVMVNCPH